MATYFDSMSPDSQKQAIQDLITNEAWSALVSNVIQSAKITTKVTGLDSEKEFLYRAIYRQGQEELIEMPAQMLRMIELNKTRRGK